MTELEVRDAWFGDRQFVRNTRRAGTFLLVGRTGAGRAITVVVLATPDPETWLAYTAWDTKHSD